MPTLTIYGADGRVIATSNAMAHRIDAVLYAEGMEPSPPTADISKVSDDVPPVEYLLCIEGDRSWTFPLPTSGEVIVGRSPEATLRLGDELVSRAHAQLLLAAGTLRITDLGSRHGTTVNGQPLVGDRMLSSGDVIGIGSAYLIIHRAPRGAGRLLCEPVALRRRVEEELERARRYQREVAVVVVRSAAPWDRAVVAAAASRPLRIIDVAAILGERELAVLLPELDGDEAAVVAGELLEALHAAAAGVAVSPSDGVDVDTLMACARATANNGDGVQLARDTVHQLAIGDHAAVVADPAMVRTYELIERLGRSTLPVLISGETGVGKELVARAVHQRSPRASGPFVSMNCAAIPEQLAESELFGHERGAFTGAVATKVGQLEHAHRGTIFFDEIGEMPLAIQAKLLRVLEVGELQRIGELKPRTVDLRIVAATNRDLEAEVTAGRFRQDLYFRLCAAQLIIPPLRDRPRDLALLLPKMFAAACGRLDRRTPRFTVAAMHALLHYRWPGNVRELKNAMDYVAATAADTALEVDLHHLPDAIVNARETADPTSAATRALPVASNESGPPPAFRPIDDEVRELERKRMIEALAATGGVQNRAAELIRMPLRTFVTKLKRYAIAPGDW